MKTHKIAIEVSGIESRDLAIEFLFSQLKLAKLSSSYQAIQDEFPDFKGAKIKIIK